jgi:hypothetical protein
MEGTNTYQDQDDPVSQPFTASGNWAIQYRYVCPNTSNGYGTFDLKIVHPSKDINDDPGVADFPWGDGFHVDHGNQGIYEYAVGGQYQIQVDTPCEYDLTVWG